MMGPSTLLETYIESTIKKAILNGELKERISEDPILQEHLDSCINIIVTQLENANYSAKTIKRAIEDCVHVIMKHYEDVKNFELSVNEYEKSLNNAGIKNEITALRSKFANLKSEKLNLYAMLASKFDRIFIAIIENEDKAELMPIINHCRKCEISIFQAIINCFTRDCYTDSSTEIFNTSHASKYAKLVKLLPTPIAAYATGDELVKIYEIMRLANNYDLGKLLAKFFIDDEGLISINFFAFLDNLKSEEADEIIKLYLGEIKVPKELVNECVYGDEKNLNAWIETIRSEKLCKKYESMLKISDHSLAAQLIPTISNKSYKTIMRFIHESIEESQNKNEEFARAIYLCLLEAKLKKDSDQRGCLKALKTEFGSSKHNPVD